MVRERGIFRHLFSFITSVPIVRVMYIARSTADLLLGTKETWQNTFNQCRTLGNSVKWRNNKFDCSCSLGIYTWYLKMIFETRTRWVVVSHVYVYKRNKEKMKDDAYLNFQYSVSMLVSV